MDQEKKRFIFQEIWLFQSFRMVIFSHIKFIVSCIFLKTFIILLSKNKT